MKAAYPFSFWINDCSKERTRHMKKDTTLKIIVRDSGNSRGRTCWYRLIKPKVRIFHPGLDVSQWMSNWGYRAEVQRERKKRDILQRPYGIDYVRVLHILKNLDSVTSSMISKAMYNLQFDPRPPGCKLSPGTARLIFTVKQTQPRYLFPAVSWYFL